MKSSKKSYVTNLVAFTILIIMAFSIFGFYPKIKEWSKGEPSPPYEDYELMRTIYQSNYVLYKDLLNQTSQEELSADKIYIKSYDKILKNNENLDYNEESNNNLDMARKFDDILDLWKDNLNNDYKNLNYLVQTNDMSMKKTNTENDLSLLEDETKSKDLNDEYAFYMVVKYDENGVATVNKVYGADDYVIRNRFLDLTMKKLFDGDYIAINNIKFNPIKNVTFVYGIPKDLKYFDRISSLVDSSQNKIYNRAVATVVLSILGIVLILALLVPYRIGRNVFGIKYLEKIPFEINCFILGIGGIGSGVVLVSTIIETLKNTLIKPGIDKSLESFAVIMINAIIWTITIYVIFAVTMLLKFIINTGVIKYFKEKLLIIKIVNSLKRWFNNLFNYIGNIDLNDKSNRFIIKVIGVNLVITLICCIFWFFGIVIAFIYNAILFYSIRKQYGDIRNKFSILLNEADRIAGGNIEVEIADDLGVFNPLKDRIEKIKDGLKKAVNEEVKSQRMKTELISNVSHDLKTPLTSIITYTDLLKNDNLTEEERKSYIDTIDKKSQRLKFLIEDLFEVSKATSGDIKLNLVNVDIVELMRQTQIELDDKIKDSKLILKNSYPTSKVILNLDSQKTFRIFENLIINVVKYAMKGSRVYIDIIDHEKNVEITIKNMSAEELNFDPFDIVDRFQRGDKSRNTEGSGLGLAIAKSFVEVQGGTFNIEIDGDLFKVVIKFNK
nr:sensor histidine kinase [Clostridium beijerinckii]